ncbi:MAG: 16S rRNA (uracil(1498)-N(3))-methyltransferase [Chitinophagales bacterium]|nr:16S rRNA (uracil(1498)-N(3))-methyltransferase [Chitinophagaceae bacterium]MCB9063706.1 16S rRNA (uracil(1498)-N(3))-methyltransferase [Chitinophagales bacterium]
MSQVPLFFHDGELKTSAETELEESTARHIVQVLRMQRGDNIMLTNGKGYKATATISDAGKKKCVVQIEESEFFEQSKPLLHIAVAFTKNTNRNEWMLEKMTELGVASIIPLQAERSEREKFRFDRFRNILVAAIIQSQQYYLPELCELTPLEELVSKYDSVEQKLVAHCMADNERRPILDAIAKQKETLLLIGPEGDFTEDEIKHLTSKGFKAISMGSNRLRTETAAVTACASFNMLNHD